MSSQMIESVAVVSLRVALFGLLLESSRRRDVAAAVNAAVALCVSLLPVALGTTGGTVGTALSLWLAVAGLLHTVGMLGPYDTIGWWDHVTHFVSASLVAALWYAALLAGGADPLTAAATAGGGTLLAGAFWELLELVARELARQFGVEAMLVHYGRRDTLFDFAFDALGAVAVVTLDLRVFVPLVERSSIPAWTLLTWASGALVGGIALAVLTFVALRDAS